MGSRGLSENAVVSPKNTVLSLQGNRRGRSDCAHRLHSFFYFAKLFLRNMILKTVVSLPGQLGILMLRLSLSEQVEGGMGEPSRKRSHGRKGFLCGLWGFSGLLPVGCLWHLPNAGDAPVGCLPCGGSRGTCEQSPPSSQNEARQSPPASARPSAVTEGDVRWAWLDLGDSPPWHC